MLSPPLGLDYPLTSWPPACNGTIIDNTDSKGMGDVIQLQGDQRNKIKEFLTDKDNGLGLDEKTIKVHGF